MLLNEIIILGFAFALFGLILFLGWRSDLQPVEKPTERLNIDITTKDVEQQLNDRNDETD